MEQLDRFTKVLLSRLLRVRSPPRSHMNPPLGRIFVVRPHRGMLFDPLRAALTANPPNGRIFVVRPHRKDAIRSAARS